ncbi:MAG TPA: 3-oxoacyl-ACP reductase family protein [Oxalicibacterium sp.]|uniref:3-oxoacyl-ACP reductase family protein n=1 Tax=Oxalicibacterium sp. TaxID=2766525 RepID=UPI002BEF28A7|nr:3-oxoacyl-ACP reductase family protein [Oxalicibacterium sp.]HWU97606.1 3-oxoacyl-ACP reductase family protein [Oxalicibacterium sp.]
MATPNQKRKIALVFGGSRGIGAGIAMRLARDGANVALTYASATGKAAEVAATLSQNGVEALTIKADSGSAADIQAAVQQTVERFGSIDIVVVNAGILHIADVADFSLDNLDRMLDVNVRGVFLAVQAVLPHMQAGGRIITIGSNSAVRSGHLGSSIYSMTKGAVAVMVKGLAVDLAPRGITINNIQPGPIETDMTADMIDMIKELIPLKRVGQPGEVAGLAAYLASEEAGYMTGASVTIDGGMSL